MEIRVINLGKNFGREWLFRSLSFDVDQGERLVILGANGSGKSTLLQLISGYMVPSEGSILWRKNNSDFPREKLFSTLSYSAPYLELFEELTAIELINFQRQSKPFLNGMSNEEFLSLAELNRHASRPVRYFSSGMKQRLKNALAILADSSLLLLDEPCSNFDAEAIKWYKKLIENYGSNRTILVCSNNQENEFSFCTRSLDINRLVG